MTTYLVKLLMDREIWIKELVDGKGLQCIFFPPFHCFILLSNSIVLYQCESWIEQEITAEGDVIEKWPAGNSIKSTQCSPLPWRHLGSKLLLLKQKHMPRILLHILLDNIQFKFSQHRKDIHIMSYTYLKVLWNEP